MNSNAENRRKVILRKLSSENRVSVTELAAEFSVTTETIRRDLDSMETENLLKRVHGGAVKISYDRKEPPHIQRKTVKETGKELIGRCAASLVNSGDVIFIDVGTTCAKMALFLPENMSLTVFTNNVDVMVTLISRSTSGKFLGKTVFLGGEIDSQQMSSVGSIAEKNLEGLYFDKAFLGVGGVSLKYGITGYMEGECRLTELISRNSGENIILSDSTKTGVRNYHKILDIKDAGIIISDDSPPPSWNEELKKMEVEWIVAKSMHTCN